MKIIRSPEAFGTQIKSCSATQTRSLVPTMGALHDGHLALIRHARQAASAEGCVIVSLFVNPTQFDRAEDLENYPRTLDEDIEKCRQEGVDVVFAPDPSAMYCEDHSVSVTENSLTNRLCGATRPGHFDGVCTVVLKLFNLTRADIAVFGKKDYQQYCVIKRMVRDLNVPIRIEGVETVREDSGLAMSSRNRRLTETQRQDAPRIRHAMVKARDAFIAGELSASHLLNIARKELETSPAGATIDYLELLDAESLQPLEKIDRDAVIATAVFYDTIRLIDNIELIK